MTHDYKRHGTTSLFAALDVATGAVIGQCMKRHRHQEFLRFLRTIDRQTPKKRDLHLSACCRIAVRAPRKLHTAAAIPSAVLRPNPAVLGRKGRVGRSGLAHGPLDAPGERQHDKDGADTQEGR